MEVYTSRNENLPVHLHLPQHLRVKGQLELD